MTRTKRKYNNPKTRIFKMLKEQRFSHTENPDNDPIYKEYVEWMKYGVTCMGNCPYCKDRRISRAKHSEKIKAFQLELKSVVYS